MPISDVARENQLIAVMTQLLPFVGYPRVLNALTAINDVAPASEEA